MFEKQTSEKVNRDGKITVAKHHIIPQKTNKQASKQIGDKTKSKSKNQK